MTDVPAIPIEMSDKIPARRDLIETALALLANGSGIAYLLIAITNDQQLIGAYGLSRLIASYGLFRRKTYGLRLERLSAFLWVVVAILVILFSFANGGFFPPHTRFAFIVLGAAVSIGELRYLSRAKVKARFARRVSMEIASTLKVALGWVCGQLALLLYLYLTLPPLPSVILLDSAHQSSLQHRTMADMSAIATALESRAIDVNDYPFAASIDALASKISPTYLKQIPLRDGWGNRWRYHAWRANPKQPGRDFYVIVSAGRDRQFGVIDSNLLEAFVRASQTGQLSTFTPKETTNFDCDIVYSNGSFIQKPEGLSPPTNPW